MIKIRPIDKVLLIGLSNLALFCILAIFDDRTVNEARGFQEFVDSFVMSRRFAMILLSVGVFIWGIMGIAHLVDILHKRYSTILILWVWGLLGLQFLCSYLFLGSEFILIIFCRSTMIPTISFYSLLLLSRENIEKSLKFCKLFIILLYAFTLLCIGLMLWCSMQFILSTWFFTISSIFLLIIIVFFYFFSRKKHQFL